MHHCKCAPPTSVWIFCEQNIARVTSSRLVAWNRSHEVRFSSEFWWESNRLQVLWSWQAFAKENICAFDPHSPLCCESIMHFSLLTSGCHTEHVQCKCWTNLGVVTVHACLEIDSTLMDVGPICSGSNAKRWKSLTWTGSKFCCQAINFSWMSNFDHKFMTLLLNMCCCFSVWWFLW